MVTHAKPDQRTLRGGRPRRGNLVKDMLAGGARNCAVLAGLRESMPPNSEVARFIASVAWDDNYGITYWRGDPPVTAGFAMLDAYLRRVVRPASCRSDLLPVLLAAVNFEALEALRLMGCDYAIVFAFFKIEVARVRLDPRPAERDAPFDRLLELVDVTNRVAHHRFSFISALRAAEQRPTGAGVSARSSTGCWRTRVCCLKPWPLLTSTGGRGYAA